ncbi:MAG: hypothetical protein NVSMB18_20420 [Acetobacteraceae bacterium]
MTDNTPRHTTPQTPKPKAAARRATGDESRPVAAAPTGTKPGATVDAGVSPHPSAPATTETHQQIAHDTADKLEEVSRTLAQTAQGNAESLRELFSVPQAAEDGLRDLHQGVTGLVEGVVQTNLRLTKQLLDLTEPTKIVELQRRFAEEYLNALMQGTAALVQAIHRTSDETLPPLDPPQPDGRDGQRLSTTVK